MLRIRFYLFILSFASFTLISVFKVEASNADLYLSPANGTYALGSVFNVEMDVSSLEEAMNSVSGEINFPTDIVNVDSVIKNESIFDLWGVQDPIFSNSAGKITFTAVKFNPGYLGAKGRVFTVVFRAINLGTANISFVSGRMLANDGNGTVMAVTMRSGQYIIIPSTIIPLAPNITSPTHPDQDRWYSNNDSQLWWAFNRDATETSFLMDKVSNTNSDTQGEGTMLSTNYNNVDEGINYFHARLRNNNGWGPTGHFRLRIDTKPPEYLDITQLPEVSLDNRAKFNFKSFDKTSGIDYFNFTIDDNQYSWQWRSSVEGVFETVSLSLGSHKLTATVYDRAGNFLTKTSDFTISGGVSPTSTIGIIKTPQKTTKITLKEFWKNFLVSLTAPNFWLFILLIIVVVILLILFIYRSHQYYRVKKEYEKLLTGRQWS